MISALKKKLGGNLAPPSNSNPNSTEPSPSHSRTPTGVNIVSAELQKKFAHGVNYNMKIVIRGDRNSGKTCLWKRIQGQAFSEPYQPTEEIQATNIMWSYRTSDHIVKLDVWDVVDESPKRRTKSAGLKLDNADTPEYETPACDAGFVDVYKNCNGVLLLFDITKPWTWLYVKKELENIPTHIPVLVMANKRDLENQRQIREEEIVQYLTSFKRKSTMPGKVCAEIRYTQSSMKNAFGLKYLYRFLNIPFLFLQRETLESMLEANKRDIELSYCELDLLGDNKDTGFDAYSKVQKESSNHEFSTHVEKAALPNSHEPVDPKHDDGVLPLKQRHNSTSSDEDNNRMVATFEEDFDSDDEEVHLEVYSKKLDSLQPEIENIKNCRTPSPRMQSALQSPTSPLEIKKELELPLPPSTTTTNIDLESWLESSPDTDNSKKVVLKLDSSEEDESHHQNPLVAPIPSDDNDSDDDNEDTIRSNEGSTSGSNMGFTVLPKVIESNATSPSEVIHKSEAPKKAKKKKDALDTRKKKKKKSPRTSPPSANILTEDLISPVDAEQYESL